MSTLLLPEGSRLLHLGPQKTGTTAIQVALFNARKQLRDQGVYIPRGGYRRRRAGWALGLFQPTLGPDLAPWERLVDEVRAADAVRACVSNEDFARARPVHIERILADLEPERVHILAVARRHDLYFPSQWQERVKGGVPLSFEDWLRVVLGDGDEFERWNVWMGHDTAALVRRWLDFVDPDRFTLVIADESDRSQLPHVFEQLLGVVPGTLRPDPERSNRGLTLAETELVRHLAVASERLGWTRHEWKAVVTEGVVKHLKAQAVPPAGARSAPLPTWAHDEITARGEARIEAIGQLPVRVIGDPAWLRVPPREEPTATDDPQLTLPVELAAGAVAAAVADAIAARRGETDPVPSGS